MGDWPVEKEIAYSMGYPPASVGYYLGITAHASANTKGAWQEFIASAPHQIDALQIAFHDSNQNADWLIDIGVGASSSEVVLIENLVVSQQNTYSGVMHRYPLSIVNLPISIPAGSRVSLRGQATAGNATTYPQMQALYGGGFLGSRSGSKYKTYGADTSDSGGVSIDPGGSANTKGSWTQIIASCEAMKGFLLKFGNQTNSARSLAFWQVDLGIGAEGSEQVIVSDIHLAAGTGLDLVGPQETAFFNISIPSGTRIAVRAMCDITDATDRLFDAILYGVS